MKKHLIVSVLLALTAAGPSAAETKSTSLQDLDQRVRILERDLENQAADTADAKKSAAYVVANSTDGFGIYSADKGFGLRIGGLIQIDDRTFFDDYNQNTNVA
jgi:phosphate-selective porin OprO/OprP